MKLERQLEGRELVSRPPRIDAGLSVLVRWAGADFPARVTNLSGSGFRLRSPRILDPGCEISLEVPRLRPVKCLIRWCDGMEAGGVFLEPVAL